MGIAQILKAGESETVEFKRSLSDSRKFIETIAAFASNQGGSIWVGIDPNGTPVGTTLAPATLDGFVQQVIAATDPKVFVSIVRHTVRGHAIIEIRVPKGDGPHLAFGRPIVRSGATNVQLSRDELERRLGERLGATNNFERQVDTDATLADLSSTLLEDFRKASGLPRISSEDLLRKRCMTP